MYNWTFEQAGFAEYWQAVNVSNQGVSSGIFWIDGNSDPWIWRNGTVPCDVFISGGKPCSAQIAAEAVNYKYMTVTLENFCVSNPVKIYFKTSLSDAWDEAKSVSFNYSSPASYRVYMGGNSNWQGIIKNIRIDPAVNCNPNASDPNYFYQISVGK